MESQYLSSFSIITIERKLLSYVLVVVLYLSVSIDFGEFTTYL